MVGEIVIVMSEEKNCSKWKMGKVVRVVKGADDVVRGVKVQV